MKYNVGDKVRVRKDLVEDETYGKYVFVEEMCEYMGRVVTIDHAWGTFYEIREDNKEWSWTDEMFEDEIISFDFNGTEKALYKNSVDIGTYIDLCVGEHTLRFDSNGKVSLDNRILGTDDEIFENLKKLINGK